MDAIRDDDDVKQIESQKYCMFSLTMVPRVYMYKITMYIWHKVAAKLSRKIKSTNREGRRKKGESKGIWSEYNQYIYLYETVLI